MAAWRFSIELGNRNQEADEALFTAQLAVPGGGQTADLE